MTTLTDVIQLIWEKTIYYIYVLMLTTVFTV